MKNLESEEEGMHTVNLSVGLSTGLFLCIYYARLVHSTWKEGKEGWERERMSCLGEREREMVSCLGEREREREIMSCLRERESVCEREREILGRFRVH